jgi:hypothetical protein
MTRDTANVSAKCREAAEQTVSEGAIDMPPDPATPKLADDLLRGAEEIAAFLFGERKHRRKVYYLVGDAKVRLPHFKLGSIICARKSTFPALALCGWRETSLASGVNFGKPGIRKPSVEGTMAS